MSHITALPKVSVNHWGIGERALGSLLKLDLPVAPPDLPQSDLAGDTFYSLWKKEPQLAEDPPVERAINAALLAWAQETPNWGATKDFTAGNLPASMSSSEIMWQMLTTEKAIQAALKRQAIAAKAQEKAQQKEFVVDALADAAKAGKPGAKNKLKKAREQLDGLQQKANRLSAKAQGVFDKAKADKMVGTGVTRAVSQAKQEAKETSDAVAGWGFDPGSAVHKDPQAAHDFMQRQNERLKQIAKMAGRLHGVAMSARRARIATGTTIAEVHPTRDLMQVFPGELAYLSPRAPKALRAIQAAKLSDAGLLGWKLGGDAKERGPFVAYVDVSGSMGSQDAWGLEREVVGKGIALGLAQTAKSEGRPYILGTFGSDSDPTYVCESSGDWKAHLDWAEKSRGGGTSFDKAMTEIMDKLTTLGKSAKGADAVIISDGEALVSQAVEQKWRAFSKETGARLLYVPTPQDAYADAEQSLSKIADKVIALEELDNRSGERAAAQIATWMR
jgi:uncharacterized protein with von Willebrand factor type A (vWA) domain